ncbi:MAG: tyrosine-protein phosphatase, partial [Defluviitaleaceae bacterium]|nr:tyrosine-protein phosphatase [Defluviitaleaceae bacterium]
MKIFLGLGNFRDLGNIKTADGKRVRMKRLLRAAQPVGLSEKDLEMLREHDLKIIIDFRTTREVTVTPVDNIDGVTYSHLDIMGENSAQAANPHYWSQLFMDNPSIVAAEFTKTYQEFATSPSSMAGYSAFIKACVGLESGSVLFHCAAGKDRTGFAAAIILKILGVSDDDIFDDYMETKHYQAEAHDKYIEDAKAQGCTDQQIQAMESIFGVNPHYIKAAFAAAEAGFGSFDEYVKYG